MTNPFSRRSFVKVVGLASASAAGAVASAGNSLLPARTSSNSSASGAAQAAPPPAYRSYEFFTPEEALFMEAAVDRLIPADEVGPGALELGAAYFIDQQLMSVYGLGDRMYLEGPFAQGTPTQGYQLPLRPRELYRIGIGETNGYCRAQFDATFAELSTSQQETVLQALEADEATLETLTASLFFNQLWQNTVEGYFCDPIYGGNRDMASWEMIGFPGARSRFIDDIGKAERVTYPPVSLAQIVAQPGIQ